MSQINTDKKITVLDAPSNLGLKPPAPGVVPGVYKAPWALREHRLVHRLGAVDAGVVVPPRYDATWQPGDGVRNGRAVADYAVALAGRVEGIWKDGGFPVVLGGDCSIVLGPALALRRTGQRFGVAYLDAHADFRHLGNSPHVGSAAGEDLALLTGRGDDLLTDIEGLRPYVRDEDVVLIGVRDPEDLADIAGTGLAWVSGAEGGLELAGRVLGDLPFWIHVDADVLDPGILSAVDSPTPDGMTADELVGVLRGLLARPGAAGLEVTILDPDLDPDGSQAGLLADILVAALT
ncbi:arginase family protein [Nonomuraea sp. NBC_01738]|uniref:arginase family protein n=1 Tax=Nonomuraea sp. NBC_01738 TaxID=2976003 RepID=UPI002E0F336D|nr:arginase family protein [Nonomuraea sp. NBC_01738]